MRGDVGNVLPSDQERRETQKEHQDEEPSPPEDAADDTADADTGNRPGHGRCADPGEPGPPVRKREAGSNECRSCCYEHGGAGCLEEAARNQDVNIPGSETEERCSREDKDPFKECPFQAVVVCDPPDDNTEPGNDEQVAADDPRDRTQRGVEIRGDQGYGDIDAPEAGRPEESSEGDGGDGKPVFPDHT